MFLLIGQRLPEVVRGLARYDAATIVIAVTITVGVVLLLRPVWLVLTQSLPRSLHTWLGGRTVDDDRAGADKTLAAPSHDRGSQRLTGRDVVALSWSGTRGVISLAAISALPLVTADGAPFPNRDLLLFCTFVVVLITLVGQGLTFAPLVRALGLRADESTRRGYATRHARPLSRLPWPGSTSWRLNRTTTSRPTRSRRCVGNSAAS